MKKKAKRSPFVNRRNNPYGSFNEHEDVGVPMMSADDLEAELETGPTIIETERVEFFVRSLAFNPFVSYANDKIEQDGPIGFEKAKTKAANYIEIPEEEKNAFLAQVDSRTVQIRNFLLNNYGSANIALDLAIDDSIERLKLLTNDNQVSANFSTAKQLVYAALNISLLREMGKVISLTEEDIKAIVQAYLSQDKAPFILRREPSRANMPLRGPVVKRERAKNDG